MLTTELVLMECKRCKIRYDWTKSSSELKMSYCGILCQIGAEGFTLAALMNLELVPKPESPDVEDIIKRVDERQAAQKSSDEDNEDRELVEV
jgi:hypothetical protein